MATTLLWADDDCDEFLDPLGRKLKRMGFVLRKSTNYSDALAALAVGDTRSLLVDIILPHARGTGALGYDLGLLLADRATGHGVRAISFLTVVRYDEVREALHELRTNHPNIRFGYFDKTELLEPNSIERIAESLTIDNR